MKKFKKILSAVAALSIAVSTAVVPASAEETTASGMRDITTTELVKEMGLGINLGNTFESCGTWINSSSVTNYETAWGSPVITKETIEGYAAEGFGVIRVPVAWSNMMGDDYTISSEYMDRVKEVTDWAVDAGLYVIINIHYDSGWWSDFPTDTEECMYKYKRMWDQICDGFADYDDHVMFESLNEEGGWDSIWNHYSSSNTEAKQKSYDLLNEINQTFVDLVRSKEGNNGQRHLLIAGYQTDISLTCDEMFKMPNDPLNRCAVSVHYYTPSTFAILEKDESWGKAETVWGTQSDYNELYKNMDKLKETFTDNGIPVIIGEYGTSVKNKDQENINRYLLSVCGAAYDRGFCPVLWDINYTEDSAERTYSFYNRAEGKINDADLKAGYDNIKTKSAAEITVDRSSHTTKNDFTIVAETTGDGEITYSSYDDSIASVDENGNVTLHKKGSTYILVSTAATENFRSAQLLVPVEVTSDTPNADKNTDDSTDEGTTDNEENQPSDTVSNEPVTSPNPVTGGGSDDEEEPTDEPEETDSETEDTDSKTEETDSKSDDTDSKTDESGDGAYEDSASGLNDSGSANAGTDDSKNNSQSGSQNSSQNGSKDSSSSATSNPATGNAEIAFAAIAVVAALMAVSRKNK
jgi:endoglucanase